MTFHETYLDLKWGKYYDRSQQKWTKHVRHQIIHFALQTDISYDKKEKSYNLLLTTMIHETLNTES